MKRMTLIGMILLTAVLGVALVGEHYVPDAKAQEQTEPLGTNTVSSTETNAPPAQTVLESTLPEDIDPDSPFAQLVRMVQAGVDKNVILAYIKQSPRFFELDADDIIYLTDLGTPPEVIEAAMARDQQLIKEGIGAEEASPEVPVETVEEHPPEVTINQFYNTLSPYGTWVHIEGYGRCWRPTVVVYNTGWQPYCDNGRWVYTDHGWYWLSNYSWGWATFHYGRWFHHARYGWCWWPDTVWAPSWVCWRYNSNYCGWAPLPPHTVYRPGVGIVYRNRVVDVGFHFHLGHRHFTYVTARNFCHPNLRRHRIDKRDVVRIHKLTKLDQRLTIDPKTRAIINKGVPAKNIATVTKRDIKPVSIRYARQQVDRKGKPEKLNRDRRTLIVNPPRITSRSGRSTSRIPETRKRKSTVPSVQTRKEKKSPTIPPPRSGKPAPKKSSPAKVNRIKTPDNSNPTPPKTIRSRPAPSKSKKKDSNQQARVEKGTGSSRTTRISTTSPAKSKRTVSQQKSSTRQPKVRAADNGNRSKTKGVRTAKPRKTKTTVKAKASGNSNRSRKKVVRTPKPRTTSSARSKAPKKSKRSDSKE